MKETIFLLVWIYSDILISANETSKHIYFSEGETVTLMCMGDANTTGWAGPAHNTSNSSPVHGDDLYIYTNGRKINPDIPNYRRLKVVDTGGKGDFDLQISNVSTSDEGLYRCDIYLDKGTPLSKEYILQLKKLPSNLTVDNETDEGTIIGREDQLLNITCNVEIGRPPAIIFWKHNGTILNKGRSNRLMYEFRTTRTHHNSKFTCGIKNNLTDEFLTKTIRLHIKYRPKVFINHHKNMPVFEGTNTTLCCEIDSDPSISFMLWSKDSINNKSNINASCLFFKRLDRQDQGNYTCFAGNEIGNGSLETTLTVYYPPSVSLEYQNYSIKESMRAVQCKGDGKPNNVTFFRLEHLSDFNEHIRYLDVSSDGIAKLPPTIESERYQDTGFYICTASNGILDEKGNMFQRAKAYMVSAAPPVFVADNKKIQYGEIGKSMDMTVKVYSASEISCLHLYAIGSLNIKDIFKKSIPLMMSFHGVNITTNGLEVTFRLAKLQSFQWFNITVCNNLSMNNFVLEVRQTEENQISLEGIGIIVLLILSVVLLAIMGMYLRNIKQRYRKRLITTTDVQTADEVGHYIEIVEVNNELATLHDQNNQMISTDARIIVENRNISTVSEEHNLAFSDSETSEHTIALSSNDSHTSEHLDDGYERPYTTLVAHNYAEEEHVYKNTKTDLFIDNSTTFQNATHRPYVSITEQDIPLDITNTHFFANDSKENVKQNKGDYINLCLKE